MSRGSLKPLIVPAFFGDAFSIFLLRQFFMTIPEEYLDAARVDGCGEFRILTTVVLRLAKPDQVGEMLGLYGLAGKFSAVIGPIAYGSIVGLLLEPIGKVAYQVAILSLLVLMVIGFLIVRKVPDGTLHTAQELLHPAVEPAIVPPAEAP